MHNEHEEADEPSRSQLRRDALAILKLAEALVALSASELTRVPLSDELREEVAKVRGIPQHIARKRQTQYLAKQLRRREDELEPIRQALDQGSMAKRRETSALHQLESWRERLIHEGDHALAELMNQFPQADRQHLRQLTRQAREELNGNRPPTAARALFRSLRELFEENSESA